MILIAVWETTEDVVEYEPKEIRWEDGSPATLEDYREHALDTYTFVDGERPGEYEKHMFPGIVGVIEYDKDLGAWKLSGRGVSPRTFEVTDPEATDEVLYGQLFQNLIIYKATIKR